jgi:hypothetical protein
MLMHQVFRIGNNRCPFGDTSVFTITPNTLPEPSHLVPRHYGSQHNSAHLKCNYKHSQSFTPTVRCARFFYLSLFTLGLNLKCKSTPSVLFPLTGCFTLRSILKHWCLYSQQINVLFFFKHRAGIKRKIYHGKYFQFY